MWKKTQKHSKAKIQYAINRWLSVQFLIANVVKAGQIVVMFLKTKY